MSRWRARTLGPGLRSSARCLHPAPSRSGHPLILRRTLRAKHHRDPSLDRRPPGRVPSGAARAGQGLPRRTRRGCSDPAPTGGDLASWIVVGAAAIHGETPPWSARLTWSFPNVGSTARRPTGRCGRPPQPSRLIHLSSNEDRPRPAHPHRSFAESRIDPRKTLECPQLDGVFRSTAQCLRSAVVQGVHKDHDCADRRQVRGAPRLARICRAEGALARVCLRGGRLRSPESCLPSDDPDHDAQRA